MISPQLESHSAARLDGVREMTNVWYPGHVAKAKRQIREHIKKVDVAVIVLDARAPAATCSFEPEILRGKRKLLVLSKADLADERFTRLWLEELSNFLPTLAVSKETRRAELIEFLKKNVPGRDSRLAIVGVPNVGKSTIINKILGRHKVKTGAMPGITRGVQWVALDGFTLLDSPGVLYSKVFSKELAAKLLLVGSIPPESSDDELFREAYEVYRRASQEVKTLSEKLEEVGRARGLLRKGGTVDYQRALVHFFRELSEGKHGRFTYDTDPQTMKEILVRLKNS